MREKAESSASHFGSIVKDFLLDCDNRQKFDAFLAFCLNHTISYLRFLQYQGYQLPVEKSPQEAPLTDIAIDVLGPLFRKDKSGQYFIINDYLARQNIHDYEVTSDEMLFSYISILLRGFVRRQLRLIKKESSPQVFNLKRRFREILTPPEFADGTDDSGQAGSVYLTKFARNLRHEKTLLCDEKLTRLVHRAHCQSINHTGWCLKIFIDLNEENDYKNYLRKHELISTAVTIKAEFVELYYHQWRPETPEEFALTRQREKAIEATIGRMRNITLGRFIEKKRITPQQADSIAAAVRNYLLDRSNGSQAEKLPVYFREQFPDIDQETYLKEYKYIFDAAIDDAIDTFTGYFHE